MGKIVKDKFGTELRCGDSVCFTINMRKDAKPIIRVKVAGLISDKSGNDWILLGEPIGGAEGINWEYDWGLSEGKIPKKVIANRVVKCY